MRNDIGTRLARLEKLVQSVIRSPKLVSASLENSAFDVYDENGSLRAVIGQQPDGTSGVTAVNGPSPPVPSVAVVEPVLGGVRIAWDGAFADGQPVPLDLSRVQVHVLTSFSGQPDPRWPTTTIEAASGASVTVAVNHYGPVWVRLIAVNTSGIPSTPSDAVQATARRAASEDLGHGVVHRENVAAGAISADLLDADAINGKIITGATVQTATEGPRVVLNSARLRAIGTNGSAIGMEPNDAYPYIYWSSVDGSNQAYINVSGTSPSDANIGINSGTFTDPRDNGTYRWRTFFGNDFFTAERVTVKGAEPVGGRLFLSKNSAHLQALQRWRQAGPGRQDSDGVRAHDPGGRCAEGRQHRHRHHHHHPRAEQAHIGHAHRRPHQGRQPSRLRHPGHVGTGREGPGRGCHGRLVERADDLAPPHELHEDPGELDDHGRGLKQCWMTRRQSP